MTAIESEYDYVVNVNGEPVDTKIENGVLIVSLAAGENSVVVDVDEPEIVEPTDPTEPEATEPAEPEATEPNAAPTEPAEDNGNDATLWIMVAVIVVALAGAVTCLVIFIKKRKTA